MLTGGGDMNEILKKRIEEAAGKRSFKYLSQNRIEELELGCHYEAGFIDGAEYALYNQWISVNEALPETDDWVIVMFDIGLMEVRKGIYVRINKPLAENLKITHWMPIPKFETK